MTGAMAHRGNAMKAVVCKEHGLPDKLTLATDWPEPTLGDHDVLMGDPEWSNNHGEGYVFLNGMVR